MALNLPLSFRLPILVLGLTLFAMPPQVRAQEGSRLETLEESLKAAGKDASAARQRLAVRRAIRDAGKAIEEVGGKPERWALLEFLFRARQGLVLVDEDKSHREALLQVGRELVKAPREFAELRLEADLLVSLVEQARKKDSMEERSRALRQFVERYVGTSGGTKALRAALHMAMEMGDLDLVGELPDLLIRHYPQDMETIRYFRDKLGFQVIGAPLAGIFKRSDGKMVRFPMDAMGRATMILFWTNDEEGRALIEYFAKKTESAKEDLAGRMEILSFNVDELPDAGESIVRSYGADWQCMHLPGGKENPMAKAYVNEYPLTLRGSATSQVALVQWKHHLGDAFRDPWTDYPYCAHLASLSAGDFLVIDPEGEMDPARPPELKAVAGAKALPRDDNSVPAEFLSAIQHCFVKQPKRHQMPFEEVLAHYSKAVDLCRKAIADHPDAPDLWIVRNRLMIARLGLWKVGGDLTHLEAAFVDAKAAMAAGYPSGCDVVARLCLAREALRDPATDAGKLMDQFVSDSGGEKANGPALAAATLLAMDVCDRARFEQLRDVILQSQVEEPMMWNFNAFLLDRYHMYWLFGTPMRGPVQDWRAANFYMDGHPEEVPRMLKADLLKGDGTPFRIPDDLEADFTIINFYQPEPWSSNRGDGLPPSPRRDLERIQDFADSRPAADVRIYLAVYRDTPHSGIVEGLRGREVKLPGTMLGLPGGLQHPLVQQLGMLYTDSSINSVILNRQGRILRVVTGLGGQADRGISTLIHVVTHQDVLKVNALLEKGQLDAAKKAVFSLVPPFDPDAVDAKGRERRKPVHELSHLRVRARVYLAAGELDKAFADAEEIHKRQSSNDAKMAMRSAQLDEDEALRDAIQLKLSPKTEVR
jgi:hypothetical protein